MKKASLVLNVILLVAVAALAYHDYGKTEALEAAGPKLAQYEALQAQYEAVSAELKLWEVYAPQVMNLLWALTNDEETLKAPPVTMPPEPQERLYKLVNMVAERVFRVTKDKAQLEAKLGGYYKPSHGEMR